MKPTIDTGYWSAGRESSDKELELQVSQIRAAANRVYQRRVTIVSAGSGVSEVLWFDEDELGQDVHASLTVTAVATDATGASYGKFEKTALFFRPTGGAASQLGATQNRHPDIAAGGVALTLGVTTNQLNVSGNDGGATLTWDLWIEGRIA
jgi:hypothetical protein